MEMGYHLRKPSVLTFKYFGISSARLRTFYWFVKKNDYAHLLRNLLFKKRPFVLREAFECVRYLPV